jgi:Ca2+/Na+ antiporter
VTLIAASAGSPEIFAAIADVFFFHNNIGLGAVVGSGVFNLLCTVGTIGVISTEPLSLDLRTMFRDTFFIGGLIVWTWYIIRNGHVVWFEALMLLLWYVVYLVVLFAQNNNNNKNNNNNSISNRQQSQNRKSLRFAIQEQETLRSLNPDEVSHYNSQNHTESGHPPHGEENDACPVAIAPSAAAAIAVGSTDSAISAKSKVKATDTSETVPILTTNTEPWTCRNVWARILDKISQILHTILHWVEYPWLKLYSVTIPDCRSVQWANWYVLTLAMSIVYTASLCWITVDRISLIGCGFGE